MSKSSPDWRHLINYETPLQSQTVLEKFKVWTRHCNCTGLVWSRSTVLHTRTVFTPLRNLAVELLFLDRARLSEANMKTVKYTTCTFSLWIVPDNQKNSNRPFLALKHVTNFCVIPPSEKNNFSTDKSKTDTSLPLQFHAVPSWHGSNTDTACWPSTACRPSDWQTSLTNSRLYRQTMPAPNVFDPLTPNVAMWVYSYKASYSRPG